MVQKKAKGGGGEVGQQAEGGEKRCSSAFSSAFSSANPTRDSRGSRAKITFFLSQGADGGRKQVTQTASGLPKKSLEEQKVENSKSFTLQVYTAAVCDGLNKCL